MKAMKSSHSHSISNSNRNSKGPGPGPQITAAHGSTLDSRLSLVTSVMMGPRLKTHSQTHMSQVTSQSQSMVCLLLITSVLISSHVTLSLKLVSSRLTAPHLNSYLFSSAQLLHSTQLVSAQLFLALHHDSPVRSSQLMPSHLSLSQLFSNFHSSSPLPSALRSSCQLILCLLISSLLFSHLLSFSRIFSANLSSCHLLSALFSALSDHLGSSLAQDLLQKEALTCRGFHTEKLLHTEAFTHRTF